MSINPLLQNYCTFKADVLYYCRLLFFIDSLRGLLLLITRVWRILHFGIQALPGAKPRCYF
jgi:hypothetical protein